MKINKKVQAVVEWIVAIFLIFLWLKSSPFLYGSFSPIKAHQQSERTYHYGPSRIIREIDFEEGKIYLCRYKEWFSANTVIKKTLKWYPGSHVDGTEVDKKEKINYTWDGSEINDFYLMKLYGYVNEKNIEKVLLDVEENNLAKTLEYEVDDERMFIFYWNENIDDYRMKSLRGIDKYGKVIYSKEF